jgi:phenylalanyl-tRNA synthetase beta chain
MSEKLKRSGIRPISPLVDITQFVMLELGQPMHAFDADKLAGPVCVMPRPGRNLPAAGWPGGGAGPEFLLVTDAGAWSP